MMNKPLLATFPVSDPVPRQRQRARATLRDSAGAADDAGIGQRVAAVEGERGVVGDVAGDAAGGAAIADLQRAGADRRPTAGVGTGENERTGTRLGECTGAAVAPEAIVKALFCAKEVFAPACSVPALTLVAPV